MSEQGEQGKQDEHRALLRSVDDKLDKIGRKLDVVSAKVGEARSEIIDEVRRIEFQVEHKPDDARGL